MAKAKWITGDEFPIQPNENVPVSDSVLVKMDTQRILVGYYDFSRGLWYITGSMAGERVVGWQYIPR